MRIAPIAIVPTVPTVVTVPMILTLLLLAIPARADDFVKPNWPNLLRLRTPASQRSPAPATRQLGSSKTP